MSSHASNKQASDEQSTGQTWARRLFPKCATPLHTDDSQYSKSASFKTSKILQVACASVNNMKINQSECVTSCSSKREKHLPWSPKTHEENVLYPIHPNTKSSCKEKNKYFLCVSLFQEHFHISMWHFTYMFAWRGFSRGERSRTEDRWARGAAELGERVGDGRERRCPQLQLLLLQSPEKRKADKDIKQFAGQKTSFGISFCLLIILAKTLSLSQSRWPGTAS